MKKQPLWSRELFLVLGRHDSIRADPLSGEISLVWIRAAQTLPSDSSSALSSTHTNANEYFGSLHYVHKLDLDILPCNVVQ